MTQRDLNLLPALKALLTEKNISAAASKLNLSQPAMSRTFARLKEAFKDPLMVRTGSQYQLTPRGNELKQQLRDLMPQLESLWQATPLDIAQTAETIIISGTDMDIVHISQPLNQLQRQAPQLKVAIRTSTPRVFDELLQGEIDFALTAFEDEHAGLYRKKIASEPFVILCGQDSSYNESNLDMAAYLKARHGKFAFAETTRGRVDEALEQLGHKRAISLSLPSFLQIPAFLEDPLCLFSVPQSFAHYLASRFAVKIIPLPFETKPLAIYLYWHERLHHSELHRWVRGQLMTPLD